MRVRPTDVIASMALFVLYFLAKCEAGEYCGRYFRRYCEYGCCDDGDECCDEEVRLGLILGLIFGIGGTIIVIVVIICICRRRRTNGIVYRQQIPPSSTVVVTSSHHNHGMVTANMAPGVAHGGARYPGTPAQGGYPQPQPMAQPQGGYPQPQPMAAPQGAYPQPQPYPYTNMGYAQAPPAYDTIAEKPPQ